jgi:hypothetical protein
MNMSIRSGYQGILVAFLLLFLSCKKEYNEFYARPDDLEQPIFQQLSSNGKFKSLTTLIEKAGYKETLSSAGYWTLFAPHDSAFSVYFKEKGLSGAKAVDADLAREKDGRWIYLFHPESDSLRSERLVDKKHHNYRLEPNVHFSPDDQLIIFRANFEGVEQIYAVETRKKK